MNRTIKDATVKRYHYDSHGQLRTHLQLFLDAYNHARRLKTLRASPYDTSFSLDEKARTLQNWIRHHTYRDHLPRRPYWRTMTEFQSGRGATVNLDGWRCPQEQSMISCGPLLRAP